MMERVEKEIVYRAKATGEAEVTGAFARIGQKLKELKRSDTAESLEGITNLLRGGGIAAGATMAANAVRKMAEAAAQFAKGMVSGGQLIDRLVDSIPVIGQLTSAARTLGEALAAGDMQAERFRTRMEAEARWRREDFARGVAEQTGSVRSGQAMLQQMRERGATGFTAARRDADARLARDQEAIRKLPGFAEAEANVERATNAINASTSRGMRASDAMYDALDRAIAQLETYTRLEAEANQQRKDAIINAGKQADWLRGMGGAGAGAGQFLLETLKKKAETDAEAEKTKVKGFYGWVAGLAESAGGAFADKGRLLANVFGRAAAPGSSGGVESRLVTGGGAGRMEMGRLRAAAEIPAEQLEEQRKAGQTMKAVEVTLKTMGTMLNRIVFALGEPAQGAEAP